MAYPQSYKRCCKFFNFQLCRGTKGIKVFFLVLVFVFSLVAMAFSLAGNVNAVARRDLPQSDVCILLPSYCIYTASLTQL